MIMIVPVATLDILTQRAHLDPEVARAIGEAIAMEVELAREPLATQQGLLTTKQELRHEMQGLRQEMHAGFALAATNLENVRQELKREIADVRSEMRVELSAMRAEISDFRCEIKDEIGALRTHLEAKLGGMTRWMLGGFISLFLALMASVYFTIQQVR